MEPTGVNSLQQAIAQVPAGSWGVAVSGGADSVALLLLLLARPDRSLHVIHLDHETRQGQSTVDAQFVQQLCHQRNIPCTLARRSRLEPTIPKLPANRSARFRALRLALFQQVCTRQQLKGVILAHHAADQAETILQRLLRGSGPAGLVGMKFRTDIAGLTLLRPLLHIPPDSLRDYLRQQNQPWREDASNISPLYQRNRVRILLQAYSNLSAEITQMGTACDHLAAWIHQTAPSLPGEFGVHELEILPDVLAHESARRWLIDRNVPAQALTPPVLRQLVEMARDAATPPRQHFPSGIQIARKAGRIFAMTRTS